MQSDSAGHIYDKR